MMIKIVITSLNGYHFSCLKPRPNAMHGHFYPISQNRYNVEKEYITGRGRQKERVRSRDLLCYFTVAELGMPMKDLARRFDITPAAVSYAVQRGEKMSKERGYQLET